MFSIMFNMNNVVEYKYLTPEVQVYMIQPEGVLCGSNENVGENEGSEWD